jgi:hypothetical protein
LLHRYKSSNKIYVNGIELKLKLCNVCIHVGACALPREGDATNEEIQMKKQALLIALASALTLGAVTTSFAQVREQNGYRDNGYGNSSSYNAAPRENDSGYSGPSGE